MKLVFLLCALVLFGAVLSQSNRQVRRAQFHCSHGHCNSNRRNILAGGAGGAGGNANFLAGFGGIGGGLGAGGLGRALRRGRN